MGHWFAVQGNIFFYKKSKQKKIVLVVRPAVPYYCSPRDARRLLKHLDSSLGEPIPEKDYGGNCRIYDHESPEDPYHNLKDKMDIFIFAHAGGYWCKTLVRSSFPSNKP